MKGHVAMPEDRRVSLRKAAAQALKPTPARSSVVQNGDRVSLELECQLRREEAPQRRLVDVSVHRMDWWPDRLEISQNADGGKVAGVDHGVGLTDQPQAASRQFPPASRQVRIGDHRD